MMSMNSPPIQLPSPMMGPPVRNQLRDVRRDMVAPNGAGGNSNRVVNLAGH